MIYNYTLSDSKIPFYDFGEFSTRSKCNVPVYMGG